MSTRTGRWRDWRALAGRSELGRLALIGQILYMCWVQGKLNRHICSREEQQAQFELMQRAQVRVVGVQADIERERSIHSW